MMRSDPRSTHAAPRHSLPSPSVPGVRGALALCLAAALGLGAGCPNLGEPAASGPAGPQTPAHDAAADTWEIDVFALGRVTGQVAPCGCTSEPLGGLNFAFGYIESESKPGSRLVLEPGSFLYPDPEHPEAPRDEPGWDQADHRAAALHGRFSALAEELVSGVGPTDFARPGQAGASLKKWPLPRVLANASSKIAGVTDHRIVSLGNGVTAWVTAVMDPAHAPEGVALTDAVVAAGTQASAAQAAGAALSVVIVAGDRALAERIATSADVDLVLVGGEPPNAERGRVGQSFATVGGSYVLEPGDRLQTITHLTLRVRGDGKSAAAGEWTVVPPRAQIEAQIQQVEQRLAKFSADPSADKKFLASLERELATLRTSLDGTVNADAVAKFEQAKITCHRPSDAAAQKSLAEYDAWVASENKQRFAGVQAPTPGPGQPGYAGIDECETCHEEAVMFWKTTVHARAYETLEVANKQFDLTCVGCHLTGFRKPGGSEVVEVKGLKDVQCEQCHGPGSQHAEDPDTYRLPAETPATVCGPCHTPEHSDTFAYEPYLRDVLGPGHGEKARAALGGGPTGSELRAAAVSKAGGDCPTM